MQDSGTDNMDDPENRNTKRTSVRKGKTAKDFKSSGQDQQYFRERSDGAVNIQRMMSPPELYISRMW